MSCKRCGKCCFPFGIGLSFDADMERFLVYHGVNIVTTDDGMVIRGTARCDMLVERDGVMACSVYEDRPSICKNYHCQRAVED